MLPSDIFSSFRPPYHMRQSPLLRKNNGLGRNSFGDLIAFGRSSVTEAAANDIVQGQDSWK